MRQDLAMQPQEKQWNDVCPLKLLPMDFLLKVDERGHDKVVWAKVEAF